MIIERLGTRRFDMSHRFLASICIFLSLLAAAHSAGQTPPSAAKNHPAANWTPPRTPDGKPDLQGIWTNATLTPLERPRDLAGKQVLTPAEAAAYEKQLLQQANRDVRKGPADVAPTMSSGLTGERRLSAAGELL
jgi:hypothetical protein